MLGVVPRLGDDHADFPVLEHLPVLVANAAVGDDRVDAVEAAQDQALPLPEL